jgi:FG-GAP-like repeat/FG-GAP repeat
MNRRAHQSSVQSARIEICEPRLLFAAVLFKPVVELPSGGDEPQAVVIADVNHDKRRDIIFTNANDGTVGIYLNKGNGHFSGPKLFDAGDTALSGLTVGDFDGDGKLDIATCGNTVEVFKGLNNGRFTLMKRFTGFNTPQNVVAADFNGDGKPDLAITQVLGDAVSLIFSKGNGTFSKVTNIPTTLGGPSGIAVADFNRDKINDFVITNIGTNVTSTNVGFTIFYGKGNGTFKQVPFANGAGSRPGAVAAGDLNHDHRPDLVITNGGFNTSDGQPTVTVLVQKGNGLFKRVHTYTVGSVPEAVGIGEFNGDGIADLAIANFGSDNITVLLGNGDGSVKFNRNYTAGSGNGSIALSDLNADGKTDIVTDGFNTDKIDVLLHA